MMRRCDSGWGGFHRQSLVQPNETRRSPDNQCRQDARLPPVAAPSARVAAAELPVAAVTPSHTNPSRPVVMRPLALFVVAANVAISILSDLGYGSILFGFLTGYRGGDVIGHILLTGVLSFVVNVGFAPGVHGHPLRVLRTTTFVFLASTLEELSQAIIPARSFSLVDLLASYAGIIIGATAACSFLARTTPHLSVSHRASPVPARDEE
jgi:polysaccharide biosynthesis protein VpsQ